MFIALSHTCNCFVLSSATVLAALDDTCKRVGLHKLANFLICDPPSENQTSLHFAPSRISRNTVLKYSVTKNTISTLYCACVLSSKILNYILIFIIANLLSLWWLNFIIFWHPFPTLELLIEGVWNGMERSGWDGSRAWTNITTFECLFVLVTFVCRTFATEHSLIFIMHKILWKTCH